EEIHYLIKNKLKIIQNDSFFKFGTDSVLLANYVKTKRDDLIIDLGSGSGVIPLLLAYKNKLKKVYGIEIQKELVQLSKRSIKLNNLTDKIKIIEADINNVINIFTDNQFDIVVSNPPYRPIDSGKISENKYKAVAKHELKISLKDLIKNTARLLRAGGRFYLVHLTKRLAEVIYTMKSYNIEPKRLKLIQSRSNKKADRFLLMGIMDGNTGLEIDNNIIEFIDGSDQYTDQIKRIYGEDLNE
ncbi:MAG: methyltransferase, partial [Halanaerobiales bacterium]|nr:methyltransferase [Halanaerobiales bacterium]